MKSLIRRFLSQEFINNFYHLPEAILANIIYGFPTRDLIIIGVTGTDGKTTTVNMIYQILKDAGKSVSMVSTINAVIAGKSIDTGFHTTSPSRFAVQKFARDAVDKKDKYLVLEVSSHGLDQYRFWGTKFDVGVITNITHDHLDYHQTLENYFLAKAKLIKDVKFAVINRDEKHFTKLSKKTTGKIVSFGLSKSADFNPENFPFKLKMLGDYNILNGLAAAAATSLLRIDLKVIKSCLSNFDNLSGRMEEVKNSKGLKIIIDFAATPNGLEQTLKTLRKQTKGKLISVFGSAGERDVEKRPMMGEVSAKLADISIITAEDPRGHLEKINNQILEGALKVGKLAKNGFISEGKNLFIIPDRAEAIKLAISLAKKGDLVGIFGKGHEKSLNLDGKKEIPWSDQEAVKKALNG